METDIQELLDHLTQILERSRWARVIGYGLLTVAGLLAFPFPPQILQDKGSDFTLYAIATVLSAGAGTALVSGIRDRIFGELVAIPFIAAALLSFAVALYLAGDPTDGRTWIYTSIFGAAAAFLLDRWFQCRALDAGRHIASHLKRNEAGE